MNEERRRNPRLVIDVPVRVAAGSQESAGQLKDICRDAAFVEVDAPQSLESDVTLDLDLPGGTLRVSGRVVRVAPEAGGRHGAAVLFTDLTPSAEARIGFFVALQSHAEG
jgi:hypothetical protein